MVFCKITEPTNQLERAIRKDMYTYILTPLLEGKGCRIVHKKRRSPRGIDILCFHVYSEHTTDTPPITTILVRLDTYRVGYAKSLGRNASALTFARFGNVFNYQQSVSGVRRHLNSLLP
jgi:hypothetical protein